MQTCLYFPWPVTRGIRPLDIYNNFLCLVYPLLCGWPSGLSCMLKDQSTSSLSNPTWDIIPSVLKIISLLIEASFLLTHKQFCMNLNVSESILTAALSSITQVL